MTKVATIRGTQLFIKVGDGGSPENFAHPCLINMQRSISFTASGNKVEVPDCDSPDDPAWTEFVKQTIECAIAGEGKLDAKAETINYWNDWIAGADPKNVEVWLADIGYWFGQFALTKFDVNGTRGDKANVSVALDSDGPVTWHTST